MIELSLKFMKPYKQLLVLFALFIFFLAGKVMADETAQLVKAVEIKGNKSVSSLSILANVRTQPNQELSSAILNEDLKRLYGMGYFTDVRIEQEPMETGGIKVIFYVVEKPILTEIRIQGNHQLNEHQIKEKLKSVVGDFVDPKRVRDDVESVKELYAKKGFSNVAVDSSLNTDESSGQTTLIVTVDEGLKIRIRDVRVTGNDSVKAGDILGKIKTKKSSLWGWFRSGYLQSEDLADDVERIRAYYQELGFGDVEISTRTEKFGGDKDNSGDIVLVIEIKEGKKYLVGNFEVKGNAIISSDEIIKAVEMKPGQPFSRRRLRVDVGTIQDLYFEKGYLMARIHTQSVYNESTDRVDLVYSITENDLTTVGRVLIQGNTKTKDIVVRRELRAYPGESFNGAGLKRSKDRLSNLGFFEDVRFDTESTSEPNTKDLIVNVKEGKTGEFSFGGGFSSIDSAVGFVQVRQKNFDWQNRHTFTGAGQDFSLRLEGGSLRQNVDLSFTEPWAFGKPFSLGFDAYHKNAQGSSRSGRFFDQKKTGGAIRVGKEFNEYDKGLVTYRLESVEISNISANASRALRDEEGQNVTSSLSLVLTRDKRDNIFAPTSGHLLQGTGVVAGGPLAGDKDFYKLNGLGSVYFAQMWDMVLELKIRAGIENSYGKSNEVPIYERYFMGGTNTVRGYREQRIGPKDPGNNEPVGGEAFWVANIEETFPIYPKLIKGAAFFDMGSLSADMQDFGSGGVFSGVGLGVRIKTPIGPVKLDAGYPLDDIVEESKKVRFYFSISQGF